MDRVFCRFARDPKVASYGLTQVPEDGLCLSAFVILASDEDPESVLVGKLSPQAPWDELGGLDPSRVEAHRHGWTLPSSHLILYESPQEAAQRILHEQLGLEGVELEGPQVISEVYASKRRPSETRHWDIGFIFKGIHPTSTPPSSTAWAELKFVDPRGVRREAFARSHEEVLDLAGLPVGQDLSAAEESERRAAEHRIYGGE